jgi:hypothetical protein
VRGAAGRHRPGRPPVRELLLRLLVVLGLAVDAVVHLRLASGYQAAAAGGIGEGTLFRVQAGLAAALALAVLLRPGRVVSALAFLVAASALGAVLLYRYVDVPAIGPLPSMYEPVWFAEKSLSAVAEAVAALGSVVLLASAVRRSHRRELDGDAAPRPRHRWRRRPAPA